jgi:hypothetical protein
MKRKTSDVGLLRAATCLQAARGSSPSPSAPDRRWERPHGPAPEEAAHFPAGRVTPKEYDERTGSAGEGLPSGYYGRARPEPFQGSAASSAAPLEPWGGARGVRPD